jgi:hypothetical protein
MISWGVTAMLMFAVVWIGPAQASLLSQNQPDVCSQPHQDVGLPITDLGDHPYVRMDGQTTSFTGGLYPGGGNLRPPAHEAAGIAIARQVVPLDRNGEPDPGSGKIVMISVGMSNTQREFGAFASLADRDPEINPRLFLLNAAQSSQTADKWVDPQAPSWEMANSSLNRYGYSPQQVQVAWIKQTLAGGGDFPAKAQELQADLERIVQNLKLNYPNIKIAYLSSRTRSYAYWRGLSPEPAAYETGFAVKWLIEKQLNGVPELNFDPQSGEVKAPYLAWGPYLWIDGENPRSDGMVWTADDLARDCTHPSPSGAAKMAQMLLAFFKTDTTAAPWFLAGQAAGLAPSVTAERITATPSFTPTREISPTLVPTQSPAPPTDQALAQPPAPSPVPLSPSQTASTTKLPSPAVSIVAILLLAVSLGVGWFLFRKTRS